MRTIFHKVSGNTAIVIEGGFRPDDNSQKNGSVLSLRVTTGDEAPSRVGKRLLRKVYPERNVMKSKPVLPAPVQQAQVSLSKGARNDLIPQLFRPSVRTLVVHQAGSGLPTNLIGLVDDR